MITHSVQDKASNAAGERNVEKTSGRLIYDWWEGRNCNLAYNVICYNILGILVSNCT